MIHVPQRMNLKSLMILWHLRVNFFIHPIKDSYVYLMAQYICFICSCSQRMNLKMLVILWHQQVTFFIHLNKDYIYLIDWLKVVGILVPQRMNPVFMILWHLRVKVFIHLITDSYIYLLSCVHSCSPEDEPKYFDDTSRSTFSWISLRIATSIWWIGSE